MITLLTLLCFPASAAPDADLYEDSVVRLSVTWQAWESGQPWTKTSPASRTTQATVVSGTERSQPWLLTTAASVENATLVRVRKHGDPEEFVASVVTVDREANLAVLTVADGSFFEDLRTVSLVKSPVTEGPVTLVRWRENQLETADGKVARAATFDSATGVLGYAGLRVASDLTNAGFAEPVFVGSRLAGLVTSLGGGEASVTPAPFLGDWLEALRREGAPRAWVGDLGMSVQGVRSPDLAAWLGLDSPSGLLVNGVSEGGSACGVLKRGDVVMSIDGHPLDGNGSIRDPDYGLLSYEALLTSYRPGDVLPVEVVRDGQRMVLSLTLRSYTGGTWLVPADRISPPPYLMAGGLVFREYDESYAARATELRIVTEAGRHSQSAEQRRIIVLASILPDPYNLGYHGMGDMRVVAINGRSVDSMTDVEEAFRHPEAGFHVVTFYPNGRLAELVLDATTFDAATTRIASAYGVSPTFRAEVPPPPLAGACE